MKILFIDLETTPIQAYVWGPKWETNIIEFIEHTRILSYSAKWLDGSYITKGWPDYKGYKKDVLDDKLITKDIWDLLNEADVALAHCGNAHDFKIVNARFMYHKLQPPTPYKTLDTRNIARKYLKLPSYSLDDICDYFNLGRKLSNTGFTLWKSCIEGDKKAWSVMKKYNKQDVTLLEKVYLTLRPWIQNHPNIGMYTDKVVCPKCGSSKIQSRGFQINQSTKYKRIQCMSCGGWSRGTENLQIVKPLVSI